MMTQGGPGTASANLPFYIYQRAFLGFDIGQSAAMGVVVVIITIDRRRPSRCACCSGASAPRRS